MKTTKRVLAVLLALAMGLALFAPMAAAEETEATNLFTKRMPSAILTKRGKSITLTPEAKPPAGVDAELQYQWYTKDWNFSSTDEWYPVDGATEPTLTLCFTYSGDSYGAPNTAKPYCLRAYYAVEGEGETVVVDNDYTIIFYLLSLSECYEFLSAVPWLNNLPEFLAKACVYVCILPFYLFWDGWFGSAKLLLDGIDVINRIRPGTIDVTP